MGVSWTAVASSADGSKLVASVYGESIYTSADSGVTWTSRPNAGSSRDWQAVASSADGSKLVASVNGGRIYTSTDSGATWAARNSSSSWQAVASSADGSKLVAGAYGGLLYTSLNLRTTAGTTGSLTGSQYDAVQLQYIGSNVWQPTSAISYSGSFTVN